MKPKKRQRQIARATLREILDFYPISDQRAFEISRVTRSTWRRWKSGSANPPPAIVELIRLHALGEPPDPAFAGFRFVNGHLIDDHGNSHTPGDIRTLQYYKRLCFQYLNRAKAASAAHEKGRENPAPKTRLKLVK